MHTVILDRQISADRKKRKHSVADTLRNLFAIVKENFFNDVAVVGNLRATFNYKIVSKQ